MQVAVQGLGRMGMQIARKLAEGKHTVIVMNRSPEPIEQAVAFGCMRADSKHDAIARFSAEQPVVVWIMLPHAVADNAARDWLSVLPRGSVIINAANGDYRDTQKLNLVAQTAGIVLVDVGVSGGIWGYQNGFPLMVGCDDTSSIEHLTPIFETLTQPGGAWGHFGASGAGHYVKMVHNAIEYGMMQSLAEGYRLLHEGAYPAINTGLAGHVWQHNSVITSWLNELTLQAVTENPSLAGVPGKIAESGEARWALETAAALNIDVPAIAAAFAVRLDSQQGNVNYATKIVAAQRNKFGGHNLSGEGVA